MGGESKEKEKKKASPNHTPEELWPYRGRFTQRFFDVRAKLLKFIKEDVMPVEAEWLRHHNTRKLDEPWTDVEKKLRAKAYQLELANIFLPGVSKMSNLEYAPLAELLGQHPLANEALNCGAPDTGNMEVLEKFGTPAQKKKWLEPLLRGKIRSAFSMTEPAVASSDPLNLQTKIEVDEANDCYIVSGHKWWTSGACRPECKLLIVLARMPESEDAPPHKQLAVILVPRDSPGVRIVRGLAVYGQVHDHAEIIYDRVRVPRKDALVLGPGRGFEVAQGRLGPGRIHHCMRTIGASEVALRTMVVRSSDPARKAFGKLLASHEHIRHQIAEGRIELTKCRQLCYLAACIADDRGFTAAKAYISMIKVAAPKMALKIIDDSIQLHGAHGVCQDSKLSDMWTHLRTLRLADGPDVVHLNTIAKTEFRAAHKRAKVPRGKDLHEDILDTLTKEWSGWNPNLEQSTHLRPNYARL